jgi:hypothetical protein
MRLEKKGRDRNELEKERTGRIKRRKESRARESVGSKAGTRSGASLEKE